MRRTGLSAIRTAALFLTLCLVAACGGGDPDPTVSDAHLSGNRIIFSSDRDGDWEIYSMNSDGSRVYKLTSNMAYDWAPSWSPDGTQIVFTSNFLEGQLQQMNVERDGQTVKETSEIVADQEIYLMAEDGSGMAALTDNEWASDGNPAWSPDGSRIAFHSEQGEGGIYEIYTMGVDGSDVQKLTDLGGVNWDPEWSPDGKKLVFAHLEDSVWAMYVVNTDGTGLQALDGAGSGWKPAWSPSGELIAFASDRDGRFNLYLADADGTNVRPLDVGPGSNIDPVWSPDGSRIAFGSDRSGRTQVFVVDADGSNLIPTGEEGIPSDWWLSG